MYKKHLGFALNLIALGLFFPGILLTMFSFNMEMAAQISSSTLTSSLINKELSIVATVRELWEDQRLLVAAMIFAFSVCIPLLKTILLCFAYVTSSFQIEKRIVDFVGAIGKWSMADVFVIAIFLAIMSTNHAETNNLEQLSIFGFNIALDLSTQTLSAAGEGFYYFTAYCVLSLIGTQLTSSAINRGIAT
ncbi:paraquat-inducible protein A [uncultured Paraglaciecola sp.]|uniref:paraquat-inducible protein A n=1 Tax=uncultured Paraglaciecola sp. TaxID=1765024 RepID=UPI00263583A7|nr:paraquat-inducible protein A [uncultured Paraglaciecola sp.]